jgi:hypothetical protein
MKVLNLDFRSLMIGFLLATIAFLVFKGFPSQAQNSSRHMISAGDGGFYILKETYVTFREKSVCAKEPGCPF